MKSSANDDFWRLYYALPAHVRAQARHAYSRFMEDPDHSSLHFKKLKGPRNFWSIRFGGGYRAVCERDGDSVVWVWVGTRQSFGKEI